MENHLEPHSGEDGDVPTLQRRRKGRFALWILGAIAALIFLLFVASFFLDAFLRPRLEARMNASLKGYHVSLGRAHIQLLDLRLTLRRLTVTQDAHPLPPVAIFPLMRFRIHWASLLRARVVANVGIWDSRIHINRPQLTSEARSKTPLRDRGWQDALEAVYPFKIDRLAIANADVVYIDAEKAKPIYLAHLNFVANNIMNIRVPQNTYPSDFSGSMQVFDSGRLKVRGHADFLMKPYPGMLLDYTLTDAPLDAVTPASQHINVLIGGGALSSSGSVESSPKVTSVNVREARIDGVNLTYLHLVRTNNAEKRRITKAGETVEHESNRPAVNIDLRTIRIRHSRISFKNSDSDPLYELFVSDTNLTIANLSNHAEHGRAHLDLRGKFMGSGDTHIYGMFVPESGGPEFNANISITKAYLPSLNPLLRAQGRIDVAQGYLSVYSQVDVRNSRIVGYVKPLFSDIQVYDYEKDQNKKLREQAKNMMVGAAAHILKNPRTQKVASDVDIGGELKKPDVSMWQACVQVVKNAFVKAILPGFDRQVGIRTNAQPAPG